MFTSEITSLLNGLIDNPETFQQLQVVVAANVVAQHQVFVYLIQLEVRLLHVTPDGREGGGELGSVCVWGGGAHKECPKQMSHWIQAVLFCREK